MDQDGISAAYITAVHNFYNEYVSAVEVRNNVPNILQKRNLRQGCSVAPTLFKIYIKAALTRWKDYVVKL